MRQQLLLIACTALLLNVTPAYCGLVLFVDDDAVAGGDGESWDTAFRFLQDALSIASIPEKGISIFTISNGKIVSLIEDQIVMIDLKELKKEVLAGPPNYTGLVIIGKRYFFIQKNSIDIYILR